jgi:N-acetylglucosaminyl-diphospho-decaprenol L-rhamnosyltransferase
MSVTGEAMPCATIVFVAYGVGAIDIGWVPDDVPVVVVVNDDRLAPLDRPGVTYVGDGRNVGFGAGVNRALAVIETERMVICNPDVTMTKTQFIALVDGSPDEVVTLRLVDNEGRPTSVVNRYPTAMALMLTALRVGRLAPRHGWVRRVLSPLLGPWGRDHRTSLTAGGNEYPLATHWPSAAVISVATDRLREVNGFDDRYFLYFEDVDLAFRLAQRFPGMRVRLVDTAPACHRVGGSAVSAADRALVARERWASATRYAGRGVGWKWSAARAALNAGGRIGVRSPA